jgi:hypothetical protein
MSTLTAFEATTEWQELIGVSGVIGNFTLYNKSKVNEFQYQIRSLEPTDDKDSFDCQPKNATYISNPSGEKIYVKATNNLILPQEIRNVLIAINKG